MRSASRVTAVVSGVTLVAALLCWLALPQPTLQAQTVDSSPPATVVKLVFIHHSSGENWLSDEQGGLGRALGAANYFVSDTNYGWGPDAIGDRTDLVDWPEWFTGPSSPRYLQSLYDESGQNAPYSRTLSDPGGENQIILFKSCFPNSNLEGSPDDPPQRGEGLTVANAKAIYVELLATFAGRPDKLFVVITAPPVQDPAFSDNARAFNRWLVEDWLSGYGGSNVAVWDYYNVLTDPDNHHRVRNGSVEYITDRGSDTLFYPTDGDDHANPAGNRKATEEFVPMLNGFYHRWQAGAPAEPPPTRPAGPEPTSAPPAVPTEEPGAGTSGEPAEVQGVLLDFEVEAGVWSEFSDGHSGTVLTCGRQEGEAYSGAAALAIDYEIAADGWASCSLVYDSPQDWRGAYGLALYLRAPEAGTPVTVIAYAGDEPEALGHFQYQAETNREAVDGWQRIDVGWESFIEPPWQGDGTARFDPGRAMGIAFSFDPGTRGWLRVDDVGFLGSALVVAAPTESGEEPAAPPSPAETAVVPSEPSTPDEATVEPPEPSSEATATRGEPARGGRKGFCRNAPAGAIMAVAAALWWNRGRRPGDRAGR